MKNIYFQQAIDRIFAQFSKVEIIFSRRFGSFFF